MGRERAAVGTGLYLHNFQVSSGRPVARWIGLAAASRCVPKFRGDLRECAFPYHRTYGTLSLRRYSYWNALLQ
jgi:hypothetical protein